MTYWEEESYTRRDENGNLVSLEEYERNNTPRGMAKIMTKNDLKLYLICGVGFFIDSYDLFIINLVTPIWQYEYWGSNTYPLLLHGAVNAAANIGNVIGQLGFGFMGDAFGRKFVYGKEMIVAIVGIILLISLPNDLEPTKDKFWYLFGFRLLMGIGIGGDYPMSAAIVAERSTLANRGRMLGFIFANQGWGTFAASVVTLILLGIFSSALKNGEYGQLDAVWRLQFGLILVPAFATLYWRLTMPEGRKFLQSSELSSIASSSTSMTSQSALDEEAIMKKAAVNDKELSETERRASVTDAIATEPPKNVKFKVALTYFSEWRHLKTLIGTALCWFFVDVAFYGVNLNQSVLLGDIGFSSATGTAKTLEYNTLIKNGYGNLIIVAAGYLPGYYLTVGLIELLGRRWIQIQGFLVCALMFGILAGRVSYTDVAGNTIPGQSTGASFAQFTIAQLFFNFGPNATTFIIPAEAYPSRVRGFAHGFSAATGKLGAILSGLLFNFLANSTPPSPNIGLRNVLWIFFACNVLGALTTFFFVPETTGVDADAVDFEECQAKVAAQGI